VSADAVWAIVKIATEALPPLANLLREAVAAGHGDADTRRRVEDILPAKSESRKAAEELGAS
jgi:hypothetical protein